MSCCSAFAGLPRWMAFVLLVAVVVVSVVVFSNTDGEDIRSHLRGPRVVDVTSAEDEIEFGARLTQDAVDGLQKNSPSAVSGRRLATPTYGLTGLSFQDVTDHPGAIQGLVSWTTPTSGTVIPPTTVAVILMLNHPDELNGVTNLPPPGNIFNGPFFVKDHTRGFWFFPLSPTPVTNMTVLGSASSPLFRRGSAPIQLQNRRRYSWGSPSYIDRYICGVCVSIIDAWSRGPETCIPVHDHSAELPVMAAKSFNFSDSNNNTGLISGTFTFSVPKDGDTTLATHFRIDLSSDAAAPSTNATRIVDIPISTVTEYTYTFSSYNRGSRDYLRLYNVNENGVSTPLVAHLYDRSGAVPTVKVSSLAFANATSAADVIAGNVSWAEPGDTATYEYYKIYLSKDSNGLDGLSSIGSASPGQTQYVIPSGTAKGARSWILVCTWNENGCGPFTSIHVG